MNSPEAIMYRLIHKDKMEYFKNIPKSEMTLWAKKIFLHMIDCEHKDCQAFQREMGMRE